MKYWRVAVVFVLVSKFVCVCLSFGRGGQMFMFWWRR
jgi:hypothetical protein